MPEVTHAGAVSFKRITDFPPGTLADILCRSYQELLDGAPQYWKEESEKWKEFDREAFAKPAIGACVFVSCLGERVVGFASFDPRQGPAYGVIGQNCILPEFRGRGLGKAQIAEMLRRFRDRNFQKAKVTTSEHPFFIPAQKMYLRLGFKEVSRYAGGPDPRYKKIDFEITL